jgi:hypothetical protein
MARCLGETPHVSPLLRRIIRLTGCSAENVSEWLLKSAVERGASHYRREFSPTLPPSASNLSDEEIAVALCLGEHSYQSANLRAAAQLLSSPKTNLPRLLRLARLERVEPLLHFVAAIAERIDPAIEPWASIRKELPPRPTPCLTDLPHWSRFVIQTGVTARGPGEIRWLFRTRPLHE